MISIQVDETQDRITFISLLKHNLNDLDCLEGRTYITKASAAVFIRGFFKKKKSILIYDEQKIKAKEIHIQNKEKLVIEENFCYYPLSKQKQISNDKVDSFIEHL